ncbi:hypothetical protein LX36DRAFT_83913 [Colletotrichum falcatum]|nr:hypothetical protein LX36DRAFT_83913 [Colletotrichum falcatum]
MDLFNKLPAELRAKIMVSTCCLHTILQLIQASPVMLKQYGASKGYIARKLLASEFDDNMVQDAMAIILFPPQSTTQFKTLARAHCHSWATQNFANPLRQPLQSQNRDLIQQIIKLRKGLIFFIEDYLTKATAAFPPREYLCLHSRTQLIFKCQRVSHKFNAANLTVSEKKRLLRAFMRYQLYSLVSQVKDKKAKKIMQKALCSQELHPWDKEAILCVHTYLVSLYGAMAAQCSSDTWLPEHVSKSTVPRPPGLLYPDSLYFDADIYASSLTCSCKTSGLASLGFDLATVFLRSATAGQPSWDHLGKWFKEAYRNTRRSAVLSIWGNHQPLYLESLDQNHSDFGAKEEYFQRGPGMYQILHPRLTSKVDIQRKIYRQRAWVFFDDARFYPVPSPDAKPHFPTEDDMTFLTNTLTIQYRTRIGLHIHARSKPGIGH